ncbi:Coenzyme F420 hydrogenase/dehydrogenase, beta subunit C-terminal domain [Arthrobacter crystallopoietes]|uniref:Coenzyme F420 hydrogenase/dehydrogenase, beta subunit C-terminal domain n=1 Tax=Crystallibacter crystallopoietes TaxID=37928 RepID=UPI003D1BDD7D
MEETSMHRIEEVVDGGMCVGCGACSVATGGKIPVTIGRRGAWSASLEGTSSETRRRGSRVCPFSDESLDENEIADRIFPDDLPQTDILGKYGKIAAGRRIDPTELEKSSSGGLTSWMAHQLLKKNLVDGVVHVGNADLNSGNGLFAYQISTSASEVLSKRKSTYYSTSFAEALTTLKGDGRRYAFVGVPCFVRAARNLCAEDPELDEQLVFFLGLVCGHLKSAWFAEAMAWQTGVAPEALAEVDFRIKAPGRNSNDYDFGARSINETSFRSRPTRELIGGNWGHGMFQLNACNYCDDIFAETADAVFGDAWLPQYQNDSRGTNIAITRHPELGEILEEGSLTGELELDELSPQAAAASQGGNYRHRRIGLAVRLKDDIRVSKSVPNKRVAPSIAGVSQQRLKTIRLRRAMTDMSHETFATAKENSSLEQFVKVMLPLTRRYRAIERGSLPRRIVRGCLRTAKRIAAYKR